MYKRSFDDWTALIELQKTSGFSVIDFCKQQHISNKTFYARRKQLHPQLHTTLPTKKPTGFITYNCVYKKQIKGCYRLLSILCVHKAILGVLNGQ